ncbi:transmembrane 4 L6 family member 5-like [Ascaphus truei]|uniref:transmembrane 4 L6 family member 5-like n=1 Tax=Ascaphus truei TaxID=8439 RepID=UPI003F5A14FB
MCTGKCSKFVGVSLYPLTLICIVSNIILLFPGWSADPIQDAAVQITPEVLYLGGIIGGGILVLIPAIHIQAAGREGCCNNRCGMFLSIIFAAVGVAGAAYSFVASILGLVNGPVCRYNPGDPAVSNATEWGQPFTTSLSNLTDQNYLFNKDEWDFCIEPAGVVEFNVVLFSIILAASGIELILCVIQMLNGLFGCLCGTCRKNKQGSA